MIHTFYSIHRLEVHKGNKAFRLNTPDADQGMWVFVSPQDFYKEGARCNENQLVNLCLLTILTGEGHISELLVFFHFSLIDFLPSTVFPPKMSYVFIMSVFFSSICQTVHWDELQNNTSKMEVAPWCFKRLYSTAVQ